MAEEGAGAMTQQTERLMAMQGQRIVRGGDGFWRVDGPGDLPTACVLLIHEAAMRGFKIDLILRFNGYELSAKENHWSAAHMVSAWHRAVAAHENDRRRRLRAWEAGHRFGRNSPSATESEIESQMQADLVRLSHRDGED